MSVYNDSTFLSVNLGEEREEKAEVAVGTPAGGLSYKFTYTTEKLPNKSLVWR